MVGRFRRSRFDRISLLVFLERWRICLNFVVIRVESLVIFWLVRGIIWRRYSIVGAKIVLNSVIICIGNSFLNWISLRKLFIFRDIKSIVGLVEPVPSK